MFEDISTFDAENPIVGSLFREIDVKKKQSDSNFIKSLPGQPGKEFEIKKWLDRLRGISSSFDKKDNNFNNNNNNDDDPDLFGPGGAPPPVPNLEDFLNGGPPPPPPPSANAPVNEPNLFNNVPPPPPPRSSSSLNFFENVPAAQQPFSYPTGGIGNDLFGSQAASAIREGKTKTQTEVDNFLHELPDDMPDPDLQDGLLDTLGAEAEDLFEPRAPPTKKEEEDEILKDLMDEYDMEI